MGAYGRGVASLTAAPKTPGLESRLSVRRVLTQGGPLSAGRSAEEIAAGLRALLLVLRKRLPGTHVIVTKLLPRADDLYALAHSAGPRRWEELTHGGGGTDHALPSVSSGLLFRDSAYYAPVTRVNAWLQVRLLFA